MRIPRQIYSQGASFVEAIIVVAIVSIVVTGLIAGTIGSLRTTNVANARTVAAGYAREGIELARSLRNNSWYDFYSRRDQTWCVEKFGTWTALSGSCAVNVDNFYTRSISLSWDAGTSTMNVAVFVTWPDSGGVRTSELRTQLTRWR